MFQGSCYTPAVYPFQVKLKSAETSRRTCTGFHLQCSILNSESPGIHSARWSVEIFMRLSPAYDSFPRYISLSSPAPHILSISWRRRVPIDRRVSLKWLWKMIKYWLAWTTKFRYCKTRNFRRRLIFVCLSTSIPWCKKSKMTKNSNQGGPALIFLFSFSVWLNTLGRSPLLDPEDFELSRRENLWHAADDAPCKVGCITVWCLPNDSTNRMELISGGLSYGSQRFKYCLRHCWEKQCKPRQVNCKQFDQSR